MVGTDPNVTADVNVHLISYGYLMIAFAIGGAIAILSGWIASLYIRSAYTKDSVFITDEQLTLEDIEDEIDETDYETDEERYAREEEELACLRGTL